MLGVIYIMMGLIYICWVSFIYDGSHLQVLYVMGLICKVIFSKSHDKTTLPCASMATPVNMQTISNAIASALSPLL